MGRHSLCLLGGTFDRFHVGHHHLISTCLQQSDKVQIWLTSDIMAKLKTPIVLDWEIRKQDILDWAISEDVNNRVSIHLLENEVGPAPTSLEADSIGCTTETKPACEDINSSRKIAALDPLSIIMAEHIVGSDGKIISSGFGWSEM